MPNNWVLTMRLLTMLLTAGVCILLIWVMIKVPRGRGVGLFFLIWALNAFAFSVAACMHSNGIITLEVQTLNAWSSFVRLQVIAVIMAVATAVIWLGKHG